MENQIKNFTVRNGYEFTPIENETSLKVIYDALINDILDITTEFNDSIIYLYYGIYYETNNKYDYAINNYKKSSDLNNNTASLYLGCIYGNQGKLNDMIIYLTISANKGNINAIYKLAEHFYSVKNISEMEKWYDRGVELDDERCMVNLANYYKKNNIKITKMVNLFNKAIDKKSIYAMNNLTDYYKDVGNGELMVKYLEMSAELNYLDSYVLLASHYQDIKDYDNMLLWLNKAVDKGSVDAMINIGCHYRDIKNYDKMKEYFMMAYDKGDIDGFYQLIIEAEMTQNIIELKKYLVIGANKNDQICIDKMNTILELSFDADFALQCENKLNIMNKAKLLNSHI